MEGAKVQGSRKKANEVDWLNANWQNMAQISPSPRRKAIAKLPNKSHIEKVARSLKLSHEPWIRAPHTERAHHRQQGRV